MAIASDSDSRLEQLALRPEHEADPERQAGQAGGLDGGARLVQGVHRGEQQQVDAGLDERLGKLVVLLARDVVMGGEVRAEAVLQGTHHAGDGGLGASGLLAGLQGKLDGLASQVDVTGLQARRADVRHVGRVAEDVEVDALIELERVGAQHVAAGIEVFGVEGTDRVGIGQHAVTAPADAAIDELGAHRAADDDRSWSGSSAEGIDQAQRRGSSHVADGARSTAAG